jgi:MinD-like ATPase involved in chromosome partitioning or flagellar assembly
VIFNVSAPELAPAALSAANTLVLVARPDTPGIYSAVQGVHVVQKMMAGRHAIPASGIYLVLNRVREATLRPEEVMRTGKEERRDFPPLAAVIADDPNVEVAVNRREPAYYGSDALRTAVRGLGNLLFPATVAPAPQPARSPKVVNLGPVKIRL